jgi:hypothetical protein
MSRDRWQPPIDACPLDWLGMENLSDRLFRLLSRVHQADEIPKE